VCLGRDVGSKKDREREILLQSDPGEEEVWAGTQACGRPKCLTGLLEL
jgi:hypothetical protein